MSSGPRPIVLAIIENAAGELLLVDRQRGDFSDEIGFPGGKMETGEHVAPAVEREVREETGIDAVFDSHLGVVSEIIRSDGAIKKQVLLNICRLTPEQVEVPAAYRDAADWYSLEEIRGFESATIPSLLPIADAFTGDVEKRYYESVIVRDGDRWVLEAFM